MPTGIIVQVPVADFEEAVRGLQEAIRVFGETIAARAEGGAVRLRHREMMMPRPGPYIQNCCQVAISVGDWHTRLDDLLEFLQSLCDTFKDLPPGPPDA
jgi:hypothetical protein